MSFKRLSMVFILILVFVICVGGKMSYVPVDAQGTGATRKEAISDALQDAVSQVNGAEIAAEMSIQCNNRPPIKLPKAFVSLGKTTSAEIANVCFDVFDFIMLIILKI